MVDPKLMCREHLQGEYRELFTFLGTFRLKRRVDGYIKNNCLEPLAIPSRYEAIKAEMLARGYKPQKPFLFTKELIQYLPEVFLYHKINRDQAYHDLMSRCSECCKRVAKTQSTVEERSLAGLISR